MNEFEGWGTSPEEDGYFAWAMAQASWPCNCQDRPQPEESVAEDADVRFRNYHCPSCGARWEVIDRLDWVSIAIHRLSNDVPMPAPGERPKTTSDAATGGYL